MKEVYLIRHGKTAGNIEKRYVGSTDEALCDIGIQEINERRDMFLRSFSMKDENKSKVKAESAGEMFPQKVYVSPMLRCIQTAKLLFPNARQEAVTDLREMDFGQFEYKNYEELNGDAHFQAFIDSGGRVDFPEAEPQLHFRKRVQKAFLKCLEKEEASIAGEQSLEPLFFIVHGGTIMAIMEKYARPHRDYFEWQVGAISGYRCVLGREKDDFYLKDVMRI